MKKSVLLLISLGLLVPLVIILSPKENHPSVSQTSETMQGKLTVTGSSTIAPLAQEIAKQFELRHPHVRVDVQTGGSSRGISDTRRGLAHIGMVSRQLKTNEQDLAAHKIAIDGVTLIVHKKNPVTQLTDDQIRAIYTGKLSNWAAVGGTDDPITVINKAEGRSTLEVFLDYFRLKNKNIKPHIIIGDNEQAVKLVAQNPHAIAYVSIGTAEYSQQHEVPIKLLAINGVVASSLNVSQGTFPLTRELNFVTHGAPNKLSTAFIQFAQSAATYPLIKAQSFVPITP